MVPAARWRASNSFATHAATHEGTMQGAMQGATHEDGGVEGKRKGRKLEWSGCKRQVTEIYWRLDIVMAHGVIFDGGLKRLVNFILRLKTFRMGDGYWADHAYFGAQFLVQFMGGPDPLIPRVFNDLLRMLVLMRNVLLPVTLQPEWDHRKILVEQLVEDRDSGTGAKSGMMLPTLQLFSKVEHMLSEAQRTYFELMPYTERLNMLMYELMDIVHDSRHFMQVIPGFVFIYNPFSAMHMQQPAPLDAARLRKALDGVVEVAGEMRKTMAGLKRMYINGRTAEFSVREVKRLMYVNNRPQRD